MKSTSFGSRLVSSAARSLGFSSTGPGGLAQVHAQLGRDDVRQRGLAQAGRAEQQHVVERFLALARRADEDFELLAHLGLADVFVEQLGAQGPLDGLFVGRSGGGGHHALGGGCEIVGLDGHGRGFALN
jgi:hypothetical protein